MTLSRDDLRAYLEELGADMTSIEDDAPVFSSSVLDSFRLVDLMIFLETRGGFQIDPFDVNLENLDSVERILAFFERRAQEAS